MKFGIVGLGNIGRRHYHIIKENYDLVATFDTNPDNILSVCSSLDELLNTDCEIICVCTPHDTHKEITIQALHAGKHVICEKPMALSSSDCVDMIEAAKRNGRKLYVMKQNRFNQPVKALDRVMEKLKPISIVECRVLWNRPWPYYTLSDWRGDKEKEGGPLFTQVSHFIDLLVNWFGNILFCKTHIENYAHHGLTIEDTGISVIMFDSGVMTNLVWSTAVQNKNLTGSITVIGQGGTVEIGGPYLNKILYWDVEGVPMPMVDEIDRPNVYDGYQGTSSNHDKFIHECVKDINSGNGKIVDGVVGMKTVKAIEMLYGNQ